MSQMIALMRLRTGTSMMCIDVTLRASQVEFVGENLGCHGLAAENIAGTIRVQTFRK
jgi:hypothetical protein